MSDPTPDPRPMTGSGCITRMLWMIVGPLSLVIFGMLVVRNRNPAPSLLDAGFGLCLIATAVARYVDVKHMGGLDGDGAPVSTSAMWRWIVTATILGLLAWAGVHGVAWHFAA